MGPVRMIREQRRTTESRGSRWSSTREVGGDEETEEDEAEMEEQANHRDDDRRADKCGPRAGKVTVEGASVRWRGAEE